MPNRIIKESICTSDSVDRMTWFEECFWQRLIVNCDDYGRFDARASVLKSRLFPLRDQMPIKDIEKALLKLCEVGCIILYEVDGKPYLLLPSWESHQTIRAKRSKYPAPVDNLQTSEIICKQMQADECICSRNPIQSESESESNPIRLRSADKPHKSEVKDELEQAIIFFKEHRKKLGKPMTDHAADLLRKKLEELAPNDKKKQADLVDYAITKGWQSVYLPDEKDRKQSNGNGGLKNGSNIERDYTIMPEGYESL